MSSTRSILIRERCVLYAPESFEYLILASGIFRIQSDLLISTWEYVDSALYPSWERFFTDKLREVTTGTPFQYSKERLRAAYQSETILQRILKSIPGQLHLDSQNGNDGDTPRDKAGQNAE